MQPLLLFSRYCVDPAKRFLLLTSRERRLLLSCVQRRTSLKSRRPGGLQAWKSFCKGNISRCGDGKHFSPAVPTKGYIISLPEDAAARKHLEQTVHALGITTEHVPGVRSDQVFLSLLAPNQPALAMLAVLLCHSEMMRDLTGSGPQVSTPRLHLSEWAQGTPARGPYNEH